MIKSSKQILSEHEIQLPLIYRMIVLPSVGIQTHCAKSDRRPVAPQNSCSYSNLQISSKGLFDFHSLLFLLLSSRKDH